MVNNISIAEKFISCLEKLSYIKNIGHGKWRVYSKKGKTLGTYNTKEEALKRLRQIEFFKHKKAGRETLDLSKLDTLTYSGIMRELHKQCSSELLDIFVKSFKENFDKFWQENTDKPEEKALPLALLILGKHCDIKND